MPGDAPGADEAEEGNGLCLQRGHHGRDLSLRSCSGKRGRPLALLRARRGRRIRYGVSLKWHAT